MDLIKLIQIMFQPNQQIPQQQQNPLQQIQNVIDRLNQDLLAAKREIEVLKQRRNENIQQQVANGLEYIGKFEVKAQDINKDDRKRQFLSYRNTIRRIHGLNTSNYVVCKICKEINSHYTNYCPKQLCSICLENGHNTRNCKLRFTCQICDSANHPTSSCTDINANEIRAKQFRTCLLCGAKGHIAKDCGTKGSGITRGYSYRRNYNFRGRTIFRGYRGNMRGRRGFGRGFRGGYRSQRRK